MSWTLFCKPLYIQEVVIERIENRDSEYGSEKYFCTFNRSGNLVSRISVAFYLHSGSYTNEEGGRSSFWAEKKACISKGLVITTDDGQATIRKYKILTNGKIVRI
jgi:hypothetical protein